MNYLKLVLKKKYLILIWMVIFGLLGLVASFVKPKSYVAYINLTVQKINRQQTVDYQYDNYYAIEAAELVNKTVVQWIKSPEVLYAIYKDAGFNLDGVTKKMQAKAGSAHSIRLIIRDKNKDYLSDFSKKFTDVLAQRVRSLEVTADGKNSFDLKVAEPVISEDKWNPGMAFLVGLVVGLILSVSSVCLKGYLKTDENRS